MIGEDGREVLVREVHALGHLVIADRASLPVERVIVSTIEVDAAQAGLREAWHSLLDGEDDATVGHERRRALGVEEERELPHAALSWRGGVDLIGVEVRVRARRIGRRALRARVVVRTSVEVAAGRGEHERRRAVGERR
ncbi:MAG: hypothetical protein U0235_12390 [Polyangiaceae bacterium]